MTRPGDDHVDDEPSGWGPGGDPRGSDAGRAEDAGRADAGPGGPDGIRFGDAAARVPDQRRADPADADPQRMDSAGADRRGAAGGRRDPMAEEVREVFAIVLANEPPSVVTAQSVLREAHRLRAAQTRARTVRVSRWGGGVLAAAALVTGVVLLGPLLATRSVPTAGQADGAHTAANGSQQVVPTAGQELAVPAPSAAGGGEAAQGEPSAGSAESAPAAPQSPALGMPGAQDGARSRAETYAAQSPSAGQQSADGHQVESGSSAAGGTARSGTTGCALRPALRPTEAAAAIRALPGATVTDDPRVSTCAPDPLRAAVVHAAWPAAVLMVAVRTAAVEPAPSAILGGPAPATASGQSGGPADSAETALMAPGATPVVASGWARLGAVTVIVTANQGAADHLTTAQLAAIASGVLDAAVN